jgi:hypothetical protein
LLDKEYGAGLLDCGAGRHAEDDELLEGKTECDDGCGVAGGRDGKGVEEGRGEVMGEETILDEDVKSAEADEEGCPERGGGFDAGDIVVQVAFFGHLENWDGWRFWEVGDVMGCVEVRLMLFRSEQVEGGVGRLRLQPCFNGILWRRCDRRKSRIINLELPPGTNNKRLGPLGSRLFYVSSLIFFAFHLIVKAVALRNLFTPRMPLARPKAEQ